MCESSQRQQSAPIGRGRDLADAGNWEPGLWRDETELSAALRYVWTNPVKHGFVTRPVDWPYSSLHREVRAGNVSGWGV